MKCPNCGEEIPEGTIYCEHCGQEIQVVPDYNLLEDDVLPQILEDKPEDAPDGENAAANGGKPADGDKPSDSKPDDKPSTDKKPAKARPAANASLSNLALWVVVVCVMITIALVVYSLVDRHLHSYGYILEQAQLADSEGRYDVAIERYDELLDLIAESDEDGDETSAAAADILFAKGRDLFILEDYGGAVELLEQVIEAAPDNAEAFEMLLQIYDDDRDYEAMERLTSATDNADIIALIDEYLILPPKASRHGGDYDDDIELELTSPEGYEIRYTLDGEEPETGEVYEEPIELTDGTTVLRAVCIDENGKVGFELTETYHITYTMPENPTASPESGAYIEAVAITIECASENAVIYYAWDDDNPTVYSSRYYGAIEMPVGNHILSVIAINSHGLSSDVVRYNYDYEPAGYVPGENGE